MPSELISELVSEVSHYKKVNLGEREAEFLARIGEGHNSSYKIFSYLKKIGQPMHYKNVNKRVSRLNELGLITKAKGESIHNAKFFALTSEGIYNLLTEWQPLSWKWLIEYKNNLILQALLYPYFEENTIKAFIVRAEIGRYFRECFHIIQLVVDLLQYRPREYSLKTPKEKVLKQLQDDLEGQAKTLAFELITRSMHFFYQSSILPEGHSFVELGEGKIQKDYNESLDLVKDKKFMALAKNIGKEYERALSNLIKEREKYE